MDGKTLTAIEFFDTDIITTLVPLNTLKPDQVYFLIGPEQDGTYHRRNHMETALKRMLGESVSIHFIEVDTNDLGDIRNHLEDLLQVITGGRNLGRIEDLQQTIKEQPSGQIYMDLTGGTELMTASGVLACLNYENVIPVYMDRDRTCLLNVQTQEKIAEVRHIQLQNFLDAIGACISSENETAHKEPEEEEEQMILDICNLIFRSEKTDAAWKHLCSYLQKWFSNNHISGDRVFLFSKKKYKEDDYARVMELINKFLTKGILKDLGNTPKGEKQYQISSDKYLGYLTTTGIWLEMLTYYMTSRLTDLGITETHMSVRIDWCDDDDKPSVDNEIDVVAMRGSTPIFISCKDCAVKPEHINEVGYLAKHRKGIHVDAIIVTSDRVDRRQPFPNGATALEKFKKLNVGLIQTNIIQTKEHKIDRELYQRAFYHALTLSDEFGCVFVS